MFDMKGRYRHISILKLFFGFFLCPINVSSLESDLRSIYTQFLKNCVLFVGLKCQAFYPCNLLLSCPKKQTGNKLLPIQSKDASVNPIRRILQSIIVF